MVKIYKRIGILFLFCMVYLSGCKKDLEYIEKHSPALKMRDAGKWETRCDEQQDGGDYPYSSISINVLKDMTEKEMLSVADYYEQAYYAGLYDESRNDDYVVYIVFFKNDTDEEIARYKYSHGGTKDITQDDTYKFQPAYKKDQHMRSGES